MKRIGITGGIGSGKSSVGEYLRSLGYKVIDADEIARELTEPGAPLLDDIREAFGDGVFARGVATPRGGATPRGAGATIPLTLDRKALSKIVFADDTARARLEAMIHGAVYDRMMTEATGASGDHPPTFFSIPLLFESGATDQLPLDEVWAVCAPEELRIARVQARDGLTEADVRARMAAQLTDDERRARAGSVIENDGALEALHAQIDQLLAPTTRR